MKTIVFLCGFYSAALAVFHLLFWKLFRWKKELSKLNFANKAIVQILNLRISHFFLFTTFLCFVYADELLNTNLGKAFLAGVSLFWLGRTIEQFVFFRMNNKFVVILTLVFIIGIVLFALPVVL